MNAMERLRSPKPMIAAQGAMMCVVAGRATAEEREAILCLSEFDDPEYRVAGRTIHDWLIAAMDVLGIKKCEEPEGSDAYDLLKTLTDPVWLEGMRIQFEEESEP